MVEQPAGGTGLRERKKRDTQRAISHAALELFAERGYDGTTVEEIAERAGVSVPTFFRHFGSKTEVIFHRDRWRLPVLARTLRDRPASETDLEAARAAVFDALSRHLDQDLLRVKTAAVRSHPVLAGKTSQDSEAWERTIAEALRRRRTAPAGVHHPDLVAAVVMSVVSVGTARWFAAESGDFPDVLAETFDALAEVDFSPSRPHLQETGATP